MTNILFSLITKIKEILYGSVKKIGYKKSQTNKNLDILKKPLNELLNNYKKKTNSVEIVHLLNIILVVYGVRPSFLFESAGYNDYNVKPEFYNVLKTINSILKSTNTGLELKCKSDNFKFERIFVFLKDSMVDVSIKEDPKRVADDHYIGIYLGFICIDQNYSDYTSDRIVIRIVEKKSNHDLVVQVCEKNKISVNKLTLYANKLNKEINNCLNKFGYNSSFTITTVISTTTRYSNLINKNYKFIKKYISDYINDFENFYISDSDIFKNSKTLQNLKNINKDNIDKIIQLYKKAVIESYFDIYYNKANNHNDIKLITQQILIMDDKYWT